MTIPVIDIKRLDEPEMLAELDLACRDWGFFQVVNHGIAQPEIDQLLNEAKSFFYQSTAQKREISRTEQNPWGFFDQELTKNTKDWKEVFDYGPQYGDFLVPRWPANMPAFQHAVTHYYKESERVSLLLLSAITKNLCMPEDFLHHLFEPEHTSFVRVNYYPECPDPESPSDVSTPESGYQGINHHTDAGALTVLLQDTQAGLEVYRQGKWYLIEPMDGALVVNIGDITQVWSNDRYRAPLHRVRANASAERFSVPFFFNPAYTADYQPLPGAINEAGEAHYTVINWGEFRAARAAGDYSDMGEEIQIEQYRTGESS